MYNPLDTIDPKAKSFLSALFKGIITSPNIHLKIPPIVYSEVETNAFFYLQTAEALEIRAFIAKYGLLLLQAKKQMLEHVSTIAEQYHAKGGADTLIIAWAMQEEAILITADERQYKKAKAYFKTVPSDKVVCFYIFYDEHRRLMYKRIRETLSE